jgi:putative cell wall-binding protein
MFARRVRRVSPLVSLVVVFGLAASALAAPPYDNSFEDAGDVAADDSPSYPDNHALYNATQVPSGTDGVTSSHGDFHATLGVAVPADFVFTRYGGYSSTFPTMGYTASIDVYLDSSFAPGSGEDLRLNWSSAINNPGGTHRRDFIFHVGTDGTGGYVASVSNNSPGWPGNPGNDPVSLAADAWYTLQHDFHAGPGGVLRVEMSVLDYGGTVLKSWVRSDASDIIGSTVGGNRYGWMVTNDFDGLAIDNITLVANPVPATTVVTPEAMDSWSFVRENAGTTSTGAMGAGPDTPPLGTGSAQMTLPGATDGMTIMSDRFEGTRFDEILDLSYSTYRSSGSSALAIAFAFNVDYDLTDANDSWQGRLVYEPYRTETVLDDTWQTWYPLAGQWWASGAPGNGTCPQSSPCTWAEVLAAFPDAGVKATDGQLVLKAGSAWAGFAGAVDQVTVVTAGDAAIFDFEPTSYVAPAECDHLVWPTGSEAGPGTTLQENIDAAVDNDTVCLAPGIHIQLANVTVDKPLTILGLGGSPEDAVVAMVAPTKLVIAADDVTAQNFHLNGVANPASPGLWSEELVDIPHKGGVGTGNPNVLWERITFDNMVVEGGRYMFWVHARDFTLTDSELRYPADRNRDVLEFRTAQGTTTIDGNTFLGGPSARRAINFEIPSDAITSGSILVTDNSFSRFQQGILFNPYRMFDIDSILIDGNTFDHEDRSGSTIIFFPAGLAPDTDFTEFDSIVISDNTVVNPNPNRLAVFFDYSFAPAGASHPADGQVQVTGLNHTVATPWGSGADTVNLVCPLGFRPGVQVGLTLDMFDTDCEINWTTIVVQPDDMQGWGFFTETGTTGEGSLVFGPDPAPAGAGSARLATPTAADGSAVGTYDLAGTELAELLVFEYSSYRAAGGAAQSITLQFNADLDGSDTWQGRLVFEPADSGVTVNTGEWYTWNLLEGAHWWSTHAAGDWLCPQASPCTLDQILTEWPDARVRVSDGPLLFKAGSNWAGFEGNVDELRIAVGTVGTIFDFEPFDGSNCIIDWQGTGHYLNLEPAIDNPACEVITVLEGEYVEGAPQVVIDRDVTIIGDGRDTTIVRPSANTTTSGNGRGWFLVTSGDVHISGVTFDGDGFNIWQAFRHLGTGSFTDTAFANIVYPTYAGTAIAAFGGVGPVDVSGTTFDNIGRIGMQYFGAGTTGVFSGNTYTGKGDGDHLDYALDIGAGAVATVTDNTITDNRGIAASDSSQSAAILVTTFFGPGSYADIIDNVLMDNAMGVAVGFDGSDSSEVVIEGNTISDNVRGISIRGSVAIESSRANRNTITGNTTSGVTVAAGPDVFDASCNWWGDASGPSGAGYGTGDSTATASLFHPWLIDDDLDGPCDLALNIEWSTIVVQPDDMQGWGFFTETGTSGEGSLEFGPAPVPLGAGSVRLATPTAADGTAVGTLDFAGTSLAEIWAFEYSSYRAAGGAAQSITLQFAVDFDGDDDWQGRLVFEPADSGETVDTGEWYTWNLLEGAHWWSTHAAGNWLCPQASPCTWDEILDQWPDARLRTGVEGPLLFKAGSNWAGFEGNVDELSIAVGPVGTTFDFEPFDGTNCIVDWQGTGHYLNLEPAIDNPACAVIHVLNGEYFESAHIDIDRDVTIIGEDRDTTIIRTTGNTGGGNLAGWFYVSEGDVHVSGLTFDGQGFTVQEGWRHFGSGSFDDVAFKDIRSGTYLGIAVAVRGVGPVDVLNSTFENIGRIGAFYRSELGSATGTFAYNTYTGKGLGDHLDYAVEVGGGALGGGNVDIHDNVITSNRGTAASDGSGSGGILVSTYFGPGTTAHIYDNLIEDNSQGITVGLTTSDSSTVTIEGNTVTGNTWAIVMWGEDAAANSAINRNAIFGNSSLGLYAVYGVDATCNWWGDDTGPSGSFSGSGDAAYLADAVIVPWLVSDDLSGPCTGNLITFDDVPADFIVEATGPTTPVTFTDPTAESLLDGPIAVDCVPASGDAHGLGDVEIVCTAEDSLGNEESVSFTATVVDTTPPVIDPLGDLVAEAAGPSGAIVSWPAPTANDLVDGSVPVVCSPVSGSTFPIGDTLVTCTATDASDNESQVTFTVTVEDTTGPVFLSPIADKTVEATSASGAHASWPTPVAEDAVDGVRPVFCAPESGDLFPIGTTEVTCTSTDLSGNSSQLTFDVHVVDTTPPSILNPPSDQTLEATGPGGAAATWDPVVAYDVVAGATPVVCDWASGAIFPLGDTLVTCDTTDGTNADSTSFTITVEDTTPPAISGMPDDMIVEATGPAGADVSWTAPTANDLVDGAVAVVCDPASGSTFGFGTTQVDCTATDAAGNDSTESFDVTVVDSEAPTISGMPDDITVQTSDAGGKIVSWTAPTANDLVDGSVAVTCGPVSGTLFSIGATLVECTAVDSEANSATESFTVTVELVGGPVLSGMIDLFLEAEDIDGEVANYAPTATSPLDGPLPVVCVPPSGSTFPVGATEVECSATDSDGTTTTDTFTVTVTIVAGPDEVIRYFGPNRYATAASVSENDFPNAGEVDVVFIAVGTNFPDGLAASAAAAKFGAPVLLVQTNSIPSETITELERLGPDTIVIVGGTAVISQAVENALGAYADSIVRRGGANRYETAVLLSAYAFSAGEPDEVIVVTGVNFPDALVGSAAAAALGAPVLLVPDGTLPAHVIAELQRLGADKITVIGGTSAVSAATFTALTPLASTIERIQGATRYETAANASVYAFGGGADRAYIAVGTNFPDALVGAAAAGKHGAPVLLVEFGTVPEQVADELVRLGVTQVVILGGPSAVSAALDAALLAIISG